jgi:hypothetical protein
MGYAPRGASVQPERRSASAMIGTPSMRLILLRGWRLLLGFELFAQGRPCRPTAAATVGPRLPAAAPPHLRPPTVTFPFRHLVLLTVAPPSRGRQNRHSPRDLIPRTRPQAQRLSQRRVVIELSRDAARTRHETVLALVQDERIVPRPVSRSRRPPLLQHVTLMKGTAQTAVSCARAVAGLSCEDTQRTGRWFALARRRR